MSVLHIVNARMLVGLLWTSALLFSCTAPADSPKSPYRRLKRFETEYSITANTGSITFRSEGDRVPSPDLPPNFTSMHRRDHLTVVDEWPIGTPHNTSIVRHFESFRNEFDVEVQGRKTTEEPFVRIMPLEGQTVLFEWVPENGEYVCTQQVGEQTLDEDVLSKARLDGGLSSIVLPRDTKIGDRWQIDASLMPLMILSGGRLPTKPKHDHEHSHQKINLPFAARRIHLSRLADGARGVSEVLVTGSPQVGLLTLVISFELSAQKDYADLFRDAFNPRTEVLDYTHAMTTTWKGEAHITWNVESDQFEDVSIDSSVSIQELSRIAFVDDQGLKNAAEVMIDWYGDFTLRGSSEAYLESPTPTPAIPVQANLQGPLSPRKL